MKVTLLGLTVYVSAGTAEPATIVWLFAVMVAPVAVTFNVIDVPLVSVPSVPDTCNMELAIGVDRLVVTVSADVPLPPLRLAGLKLAPAPVGSPLRMLSATLPL